MLRNNNLRIRYIASLLLVMVPILIFSVVLYTSTTERSIQYINDQSLQRFTSATENISNIVDRLQYTATTAFGVESEIGTDERGRVTLISESGLCAALTALEERITPDVTVLFYIKGDKSIYSSQGKMLYGDYERQVLAAYDPTSSSLYTQIQGIESPELLPLLDGEARKLSGLVYALPFPTGMASKGVMLFVLSDDVIASEFENYLGTMGESLYLYDSKYTLLYEWSTAGETLSVSDAMRIRGMGIVNTRKNGRDMVSMRVSDSNLGLFWVLSSASDVFYSSMKPSQNLMLVLILTLILLTCGLIVWIAFFNYKPIQELLQHVTGRKWTRQRENELDLIRSTYDQTVDEAQALSEQLNEMTPLIAQQFVRRLIFGRIKSPEECAALASRADMDFHHEWVLAMYLSFSGKEAETQMEQAALTASRFSPMGAFAALGELPGENALCVLISFDASEDAVARQVWEYAQQLYAYMQESGVAPNVIGIGSAYHSPLQMNESFAEACAAVQLMPPNKRLWRYGDVEPDSGALPEDSFHGLSPLSVSLLSEGLHRGDCAIALRALNDMLQNIAAVTHSLAFFRFCCSELLATLIRQANSLHLPLSKTSIQHLITITSPEEFSQQATQIVSELCEIMRRRISEEDSCLKRRLIDYILTNFKSQDLSIQSVAEGTGIPRGEISTLLKEETGQGFVQYVSYLRLNEFKRMLEQSDLTIRELVLYVGYNDVPNFLRKFKFLEGMTPGQYRQLHRKQP